MSSPGCMEATLKSTAEEFQHPRALEKLVVPSLERISLLILYFRNNKNQVDLPFIFLFLTETICWNGVAFGQTLDKA